jgi:hypothetical protein
MPKKSANAKSERRTEIKKLSKPEQRLGKGEMKKVKGGDWLMSPAGSVKPKGV